MGPAIRIVRSGGAVAADALTAAPPIKPRSHPSAGRFVVQNNRVAKGIVEGALTVSLSQARKRCATVCGDRRSGDVDRVGIAAS
jgi:hypothetical protein